MRMSRAMIALAVIVAASLVSAAAPEGSFADILTQQSDLSNYCRTWVFQNQFQTFVPHDARRLTAIGMFFEADVGFELYINVHDYAGNDLLSERIGQLHCLVTRPTTYEEVVCNALDTINLNPDQTYAFNMNYTILDANNEPLWSEANKIPIVQQIATACTEHFYSEGFALNLSATTDLAFSTYLAYDIPPKFKEDDYYFNILDRNDDASSVIFFNLKEQVNSTFPFAVSSTEMMFPTGGKFVPHYEDSTGTFAINFFETYSLADLPSSMLWIVYVMDSRSHCKTAHVSTEYGCQGRARLHLNLVRAANITCPGDLYLAPETPTATWSDISMAGDKIVERLDNWSGSTFPLGVTHIHYALAERSPYQYLQSATVCNFTVYVSQPVSISSVPHFFERSADSVGLVDYLVDAANVFSESVVSPTLEFAGQPAVSGASFRFNSASNSFRLSIPTNHTCRFQFALTWCVPGHSIPSNVSSYQPAKALLSVTAFSGTVLNTISKPLYNSMAFISGDGMCMFANGTSDALQEVSFTAIVLSVLPKQPHNFSASATRIYNLLDYSFLSVITEPEPNTATFMDADPGPSLDITDRVPPEFTFCPSDLSVTVDQFQDGVEVSWETPIATDNLGPAIFMTSMQPGHHLLLKNSPYTVTYTANDMSGLKSTCVFTVTLTYQPISTVASATLTTATVAVEESGKQGKTIGISNYLVRGTDDADYSLNAEFTSSTTRLVFNLAASSDRYRLKPAGGDSQQGSYSSTSTTSSTVSSTDSISSGEYTRVEVDMIWALPEYKLTTSNTSSMFSGFSFIGATVGNTANDEPFEMPSDWFVSDSLSIITDASYIRIKGFSKPVKTSFTFAGVQLVLNFPLGHQVDGVEPLTFELLDSSYIRVTTYTSDQVVGATSDALRLFDVLPPVIDNCPASVLKYSSELPYGLIYLPISWPPVTMSDNNAGGYISVNASSYDCTADLILGERRYIEYSAYDAFGNKNIEPCVVSLKFIDDIPPFIQCPANVTIPAINGTNYANLTQNHFAFDTKTYTDNSNSTYFQTERIKNLTFTLGETIVTRRFYDAGENVFWCNTSVKVIDTQPPVITNCDPPLELESPNGINAKAVWNIPQATDNSGFEVSWTAPSQKSGDYLPVGVTDIVYTATDPSGVSATCTITVTIKDSASSTGATSSSSSTTLIMGISISAGVVALILIVMFAIWNQARRKMAQRPQNFDDIIASLADINREGGKRVPREIKRPHVKILDVLGKGNFGEVSKGLLAEIPGTPGYLVAIKSLHPSLNSDRGAILQEAAIMAQFDHPHVTGLVGVVTVGEPLLVIIEYCEHGALNKYLENANLTDTDKHMIGGDCAEGLAYLASLNYVHRDIAARNVLVSSEKRAKISDFGMSRETAESEYYQSKGGQLPVRWTAPEALEQHKFSTQSDIWSFGVLLHEIWTKATLPYKGMTNQKVWVSVASGYRLPCPEGCPQAVHDIMMACWKECHERPSFESMAKLLRDMQDGVTITSKDSTSRLAAHDYIDFSQRTLQSITESSDGKAAPSAAAASSASGNLYASETSPPPSPTKAAPRPKPTKRASASSVKSAKNFYDISTNVVVETSTYEEPVVLSAKRPSLIEESKKASGRSVAVAASTSMSSNLLKPLLSAENLSSSRQFSDPYIEVLGNASDGPKDEKFDSPLTYDLASRHASEDVDSELRERRASSAEDADLHPVSVSLSNSLNMPVVPPRGLVPVATKKTV